MILEQGKLSGTEGHDATIKGTILQDNITILDCMNLTTESSKHKRQYLIERHREAHTSTITGGHFNTLLSVTETSSRQKIIMDVVELNSTLTEHHHRRQQHNTPSSKLEIRNRKIRGKSLNTWKSNSTPLNNPLVKKKTSHGKFLNILN